MKRTILLCSLLLSNFSHASTPINGWYSEAFGGYAYLPNNLNTPYSSLYRSNALYNAGYNAGGSIGFKSNPMRYEGELTYISANLQKFQINNVQQTGVNGYTHAFTALANVYYDFPNLVNALQPFLGVGVGYGLVNAHINSTGPLGSTQYSGSSNVLAYQGTGGITYNFSESYALNFGYRYVITTQVNTTGRIFQAQLANLGAVYRFDGKNYK